MTFATAVNKTLAYKAETTWGTAPSAGGAQYQRRVTSTLSLKKQTYESQEINTSVQRQDFRHGVRSVGGSITGELSAGTWKDFFAAVLRRAFTTVTAITGLSITISGTGPTWTVARSSGSWITDGVKVGDIWRLTAGSFNAANLNKNLIVVAETALNLTVALFPSIPALVAEGPIATATLTLPGKKTFAPASGQTDVSFSIEHYHQDLTLSELFLGCKIDKMALGLPPTGMATMSMDFMGKDITTAGSQYYTTPTVITSTGVLASVNGILQAQGGVLATVTGLTININDNMSAEPLVGSNTYGDIAEGLILVDGQVTAVFDSGTMRDYFINETEVALSVAMSASNVAGADFLAFTLPRIKFGGADKDDGQKTLIQTLPFTGLYNVNGGAGTTGEQSTLVVQDSQA